MKELFVIESCYNPIAASTNRLFAFGENLTKKGVKVHFFYLFPDSNRSKSNRYTDLFEFHYLWDQVGVKNKYICAILSLCKLRPILKPEVPVYVYSLLNCLYFIASKKNIKVYHEYTENPEVVGKVNNLMGKILFSLYKKAVRQLKGLFVITPSLKDYYIKEFKIDPQKVIVLNMIVDCNRFQGLEHVPMENTISYCGTVSEGKDGISYLLKAFAIVKKTQPEVKLQIIGPFENEETKGNVLQIIEDNGLKNDVVLTGPIPPSQMPQLLRSSKILALARPKQKEKAFGFATKIGEYLMTERPVVMTNVGNVSDYLTDMKNVILAKPNDEIDLANKFLWVIDNEKQASIIGKEGRVAALKYFNSEIEAEKIYNRIFG